VACATTVPRPGITTYLENDGTLEEARREDRVTLDEGREALKRISQHSRWCRCALLGERQKGGDRTVRGC